MPRNLSDKPHKTPHPDQPHAMGPGKERNPVPVRPASDEAESDAPTYDSCFDDLNLLLAASINEPDPNLESAAPGERLSDSPRIDESAKGSVSDRGKAPRTSEIFRALAASAHDAPSGPLSHDERSQSIESADSLDEVRGIELTPDRPPASGRGIEGQPDVRRATDTDDSSDGSPFPWMQLLLLSYSSALTLALIWAIWHGWLQRPPVQRATDSKSNGAESASSVPETKPAGAIPPIPTENLARLGETIRIGELEVTPLSVMLAPLTLVRTVEPFKERDPDGSSLVLRLRLTNISKDHAFAPLEPGFLRDSNLPLDRSYIETATGDTIRLFPLAIDSEWSIQGEEFSTLKPGESLETTIGSEPGAADKFSSEMTWRVRVRIGPYRTDLLGARFTKDEVVVTSKKNRVNVEEE